MRDNRTVLTIASKVAVVTAAVLVVVAVWAEPPQQPAPAAAKQSTPVSASKQPAPAAAKDAAGADDFYIHAFHATQLQLDCSTCHTPAKAGSVELKRPGHEQCMVCHAEAFGATLNQKICAQCHTAFPPTGAADVRPFPRYKRERAILFEFSHAKHVDPKARLDAKTGFRADCTFCHKFEPSGVFATFPGHVQCAECHSTPGMKPSLTADATTADCRGCHTPEETENPGFTGERHMIAAHVVSGKYVNVKFTHAAHFKVKDAFNLNCTTCHYAVPRSNSLADLTLPKMLDCVECHDNSKTIAAQFRMSNCSTCHIDSEQPGAIPNSHTRNVKPDFHNESFRKHHEEQATAPGAKCFVCHQNVTPSVDAKAQCTSCHQVMRPVSHTPRWKDDIHGQFAALDRESCATCHTQDTCNRCHNELPRSHAPLPLFKAGAHAQLAMLNERSCLTCHSFQGTCAECHTKGLAQGGAAGPGTTLAALIQGLPKQSLSK